MDATTARDRNATEQVVGTPWEFFHLLDKDFAFQTDLAAVPENAKCVRFFSPEENSLSVNWSEYGGWLWLNPPFANIGAWARKCWEESQRGARIVMLVPNSTGTTWFRDWVWGKAEVRFLIGRLTFEGHHQPYPKDLMLCVYERGRFPRADIWDWRSGRKDAAL